MKIVYMGLGQMRDITDEKIEKVVESAGVGMVEILR